MAFGLNRAEVICRLGADVTINHLAGAVTVTGWCQLRVASSFLL